MPLVADWATTAALLAVLLAEGVRRLPAGAIVLRRTLRGSWRVVHGPTGAPEWRLVSTWAPFSEHLVVQAGTSAGLSFTGGDDRDAGRPPPLPSRLTITTLRAAGGAILLLVALGVPMATATFGVPGLVRSIGLAVLSSTVVAFLAAACLRRIAGGWKAAFTTAAPLLSPFAATRAAELLLQVAVNGLPAPSVLQALVRPDDFARWFRVHAYDTIASLGTTLERGALDRLHAIVAIVPDDCGDGHRFCPRCAAVFRPHVEECSDCASVVLRDRESVAPPLEPIPMAARREEPGSAACAGERLARYVN